MLLQERYLFAMEKYAYLMLSREDPDGKYSMIKGRSPLLSRKLGLLFLVLPQL